MDDDSVSIRLLRIVTRPRFSEHNTMPIDFTTAMRSQVELSDIDNFVAETLV